MPTYDYHCSKCSHVMEAFQKITDAPLKKCPQCGKATLHRGPGGGVGLSFKGSGFYITDYGPNNENNGGACRKGEGGKDGCCPCSGQRTVASEQSP